MRRVIIMSIMIFTGVFLSGCSHTDPGDYAGLFLIKEVTLGGVDITDEYVDYRVEIAEDGSMTVFINYLGVLENRSSTWTVKRSVLIETYGSKTYRYEVSDDFDTLTYEGELSGENLVVILERTTEADDGPLAVDFESVLFGEPLLDTKRFNYAPAVIVEENDEGQTVMHIWYCMNHLSGIIMDHIGYRQGIRQDDGKWLFSDEEIALAPTPGTWDSRHVCDPTVIRGSFTYQGVTYPYMMSYLGCTTDDYSNNETGLAVAMSLEGPWTKLDHLNPIVPWDRDNPSGRWGTGMPSLMSVDGEGKVILFYSNSAVGIGVEHWDFSNLDDPDMIYLSRIDSTGATNPNGTPLTMGIADFGYDPVKDRLYIVSYTNTKNPPDVTVTRVNSHGVLAYIGDLGDMQAVVELLRTPSYAWTVLDYVGPEDTGFERNHNLGLVKDQYGNIIDSDHVMTVVSTGHNSWGNENIFTYRLMGYIFETGND